MSAKPSDLPILVREMYPTELSMVLANWKNDIAGDSDRRWGKGLSSEEFWAIVNYAIDRISLPSAVVFMACHENEPAFPLAWIARRDGAIIHMHARKELRFDYELAALIHRRLIGQDAWKPINPILELKR